MPLALRLHIPINNRTVKEEIGKETTPYMYNNLNQLVETIQGSTVATYGYDKRGNVAEVEENGDTKLTYVFDSTNKMSKVVTYKDNTSGSGNRETITTKYVGAGNRVNAKVELNGSITSNTTYVVDGESSYNDIIMAKDSVSGKTSIFTFSDEVISVETSGNISYYRTDEKHSVTDILDTAGKVKATIEYDEYGVIVNPEVVSTGGNIFAYTGHVYEESTGLYYAKARYYDAGIGRFVSEDSYRGEANDPTSLNLYGYVKNNPVKYVDSSGYYAEVIVGFGALVILLLYYTGVSMKVTGEFFSSGKANELLKNVKTVICDGVTYTVKKFKQKFSKELEWEAIAPPSIKLAVAIPKPIDNKTKKENAKSDSKVRDKKGKVIDESEVPKPRKNNKKVKGRTGNLSTEGEANSSTELYNENGKLIQRRYYDKNGKVEFDIDFSHGVNHKFPHIHNWKQRNSKVIVKNKKQLQDL